MNDEKKAEDVAQQLGLKTTKEQRSALWHRGRNGDAEVQSLLADRDRLMEFAVGLYVPPTTETQEVAAIKQEAGLSYTTRVRVEIEVALGQAWSPKETAENAMASAEREAMSYLRNLSARERFRVVGGPQVLNIVTKAAR